MIREAERHAAEDAEKKETIEAFNQAESVLHDTETKITEYADQINAEEVCRDECEEITEIYEITG
jgi:molecular chaperone DnaK